MTERLDYLDAYQDRFDAQVLAILMHAGRPAVVLDRSCFYPTSGGQLHDTGRLGSADVVDVVAAEGAVLHLLAAPSPFTASAIAPGTIAPGTIAPGTIAPGTIAPGTIAPGTTVTGAIDWPRRYDHMQQHSGQHLLSQLFYQRCGFETLSVHFGGEESTLDLDVADLAPALLDDVEREANELAYRALDIHTYFVDDREVARLPLRRPPAVAGQIRIVEIDGFDYSACGGTHVHTTAEIAPIKLVRQERRRSQTRLTFLCGQRAVEDYRQTHRLLAASAALFSTAPDAVPALTQRLQSQVRELQQQNQSLQEQLLAYEIADRLAAAPHIAGATLVEVLVADRPAEALKQMAAQLRTRPQVIGLLATTAGDKLTVLFCRSDDVTLHMGDLLRDALAAFGGRGGGRPEYAQGGGIAPVRAAELLAHARALLAAHISAP